MSGTITIEEVRRALKTLGQEVSDEEVADLMGEVRSETVLYCYFGEMCLVHWHGRWSKTSESRGTCHVLV